MRSKSCPCTKPCQTIQPIPTRSRAATFTGAQATPAIEGFLAVATGAEGQAVVDGVRETEGAAVAQLAGAASAATTPMAV